MVQKLFFNVLLSRETKYKYEETTRTESEGALKYLIEDVIDYWPFVSENKKKNNKCEKTVTRNFRFQKG